MAPLNRFFCLAELNVGRFELPNNDHLVVCAGCKVLAIRREAHAVHGLCVPILQVIEILRRYLEGVSGLVELEP